MKVKPYDVIEHEHHPGTTGTQYTVSIGVISVMMYLALSTICLLSCGSACTRSWYPIVVPLKMGGVILVCVVATLLMAIWYPFYGGIPSYPEPNTPLHHKVGAS